MTGSSDTSDLRERIENVLAVIGATPANDVRAVRQTFELTKQTLEAVRAGLDELEAQLDVVTAPERNAAKDIVALQRQLEEATVKIAGLEQKVAMSKADQEAEHHLREEEHKRLTELERKARDFEDILATDQDAFAKYFEKALDEKEKKAKRRPKR